MKIDSSPASQQALTPRKITRVDTKPESTQTTHTKATTEQSTQARMLHWFAQAGVDAGTSLKPRKETDQRLAQRRYISAQRRLQNLEAIFQMALSFSSESEQPDNLDPDWFFSFTEMAENIYSPTMQELWAKIFAVEVGRPGTFSLRTLSMLKQMTQKDAAVLKRAMRLTSTQKGTHSPVLLEGYYQKPSLYNFFASKKLHQLNLAEFGLPYPDLLALMDLGLIFSTEIESAELAETHASQWRYGKQHFELTPKRSGIALVYYKFTATGIELSRLVQGKNHEQYFSRLKQILSDGFEIG